MIVALIIIAICGWFLAVGMTISGMCEVDKNRSKIDSLVADLESYKQSPVRYFYRGLKNSGYGVYADYGLSEALVKTFVCDDEAFNKLCAEELVEKLNEQI